MRSAMSTWGSKSRQWTRRLRGYGGIKPRLPAQHAHDDFGGKRAVGKAELVEPFGMQQLAGVGVLLLDPLQDVEGSRAREGDTAYELRGRAQRSPRSVVDSR